MVDPQKHEASLAVRAITAEDKTEWMVKVERIHVDRDLPPSP